MIKYSKQSVNYKDSNIWRLYRFLKNGKYGMICESWASRTHFYKTHVQKLYWDDRKFIKKNKDVFNRTSSSSINLF